MFPLFPHLFAMKCWNGILLSYKKESTCAIYRNMDKPREYHTEWSKSEKQILHVNAYMWNLEKNSTDEPIFKAEVETQT